MNGTGVKFIVWFLFLSVFSLKAQDSFEGRYLVRELDMEQGLPCSFVDDVTVDSAGFLWVATSGGGLCRNDGYELLTFNTSTDPALRSNFIRSVVEDSFHRLWIASEGGLDVLDLYSLTKSSLDLGLPDVLCSYVMKDSQGAVWTKFADTLYRISFDGEGTPSRVCSFSHPGLADVNHVFKDVDQDGSVWTRLDEGLYKIAVSAADTLEAMRVVPSFSLPEGTYVSDFLASGSSIWMATEIGLYRLYRGTGEWKRYVHSADDPHSLTQNFVSSLAMTQDGLLLASTLHGLNVYNPMADNFDRVGTDIINGIKTVEDRLVVGTENRGVRLAEPKSLYIQNVANEPGNPSSLAAGAVNAMWQEAGGRLWVGSVEGGLSIKDPSTGAFRHLTREKGGLAHNSVSALRPGPGGKMYVGTWGSGIDVVSMGPSPRVERHLPGDGLHLDYIGVLEYDTLNQRLWVGSNRGIFLYNPENDTFTLVLETNGCIGSCIDSYNQLWIGCQEGLYVFDLNEGGFPYIHYRYKLDQPESRIEDKICCIMEASPGNLYLGSNGSGFYHAARKADGSYHFANYSTRNGLSNDRVRGFCRDGEGRIWISTEYGLNLLNPRTGIITPFYQKDGLQNVQFHWNNACEGTDGLLYFGHAQGYTAVNPTEMSLSRNVPLLFRFTRVSAGSEDYHNPFLSKVEMHEKDRSLLLQFAVLRPDAASYVKYRYQLEGYDAAWRYLPDGRREVSYSSLPPGKYTFQAEAVNRFGVKVGTLSLDVRVKPFFYHTWWFAILGILAVAGLAFFMIWYRTRTLKRRQQALEETVELRTRELRRQNEVLQHQNEELASRKMLSVRQQDPFKEKALETLRSLYRNPDLDVSSFCQAMGMSKTLLNTHVQEAFGQSIGQFIRTYRLTLAREMLESGGGMTVAEVAYEVGFNDPKYFTRCFSKEFNTSPSTVQKSTL